MPSLERSVTHVIILVILHLPQLQTFPLKHPKPPSRLSYYCNTQCMEKVLVPNNKLWFLPRLKKYYSYR